jgi:hypothetical protein
MRGQALIFVLMLLLTVGIFLGYLSSMWEVETQVRALERNGMIALYMAQAGIERAKITARYGLVPLPYSSPAQTLNTGRYSFSIQDLGGDQRLLQAIGQKLDVSGNVLAEKQLEIRVQGMGTLPTADDVQIPWSWRQM